MILISNKPIISHLVFLFSIIITTLSIIPALFPILYSSVGRTSIITTVDKFEINVNPFEPGLYFIPIIVTGIIVLVISIIIKFKSIKLRSIDISKKYSYISLIIILATFTVLSYENVNSAEVYRDWQGMQPGLSTWPSGEMKFEHHVNLFLLLSSFAIFGNYKVIPFLSSLILIVATYLIANKMTNNRMSGLIASVIVLQSNLFLTFSTSASYPTFWILFYLISLLVILHKTWFLSPITYIVAIFSKILIIAYFPITLFFILNAKISIKKKIILSASFIILIAAGSSLNLTYIGIEWDKILNGFISFSYQMRFDGLIIVFLIPIVTGLYLISKNNQYANTVSIMISWSLISSPLLLALTEVSTQPYRWIPLVVFCAIGAAMILTNQKNEPKQVSKKKPKQVSKKSR